jgi:uncharacterized UPF0146 family protein
MEHIAVYLRPFVVQQEVTVYQNGECIYQTQCPLTNIEDKLIEVSDKFNVKQIDLAGDFVYGNKIKEDIQNPTKYNLTKQIKINVL